MARNKKKGRGAQKRSHRNGVDNSTDPRNPEPISEFCSFVERKKRRYIGLDSSDNDKNFIPLDALQDYWTNPRINKVLKAFRPSLTFDIDTIRNHYIRTFSTLVYCGCVANLGEFTKHNLDDGKLPLRTHPGVWDGGPYFDKLFSAVFEHQWCFFPLIFSDAQLDDCHLDDNHVLPIEKQIQISHGDAATIQQIRIHDSCNSLVKKDRDRPIQQRFVLKTYHRPKFEKLYENEVKALRMLKNSRSPNVITYYGSFRQTDTYNIILEYADGGDLAGFLKTRPPKGADVMRFWRSLIPCLIGLGHVHRLMLTVEDHDVNGIHEDVKPDNILLFKGRSGSHYDFTPKIADFGLFSHVRGSKSNSSEAMGLDTYGNQCYSSPECSHSNNYREIGPNAISTKADIFSYGAVLSDACAWVKGGSDEKVKYFERRREYHRSTVPAFSKGDYEGCFHDGLDRLPVVDDMHKKIREYCRSVGDRVTPRIIDVIEQHMLLRNPNDRYNATDLIKKFDQILDTSNNEISDLISDAATLDPRSAEKLRGPSLLTLGGTIATPHSILTRETRLRDSTDKEIQELVEYIKTNVPDRHHLLFIDDSTSMKEHLDTVKRASLALLDLTSLLQEGNVEISFASDPKKLHRTCRTKKLARLLAANSYAREPNMMEDSFRRLVDNVIIPHLPFRKFGINVNFLCTKKPTSIYVFTDGNWGNDELAACGVENPLGRLKIELRKRNLDRNHISFHFIRFGDSEDGRRHLNHLDNFGEDDNWDNVDVKSVSNPAKMIIIGPLSLENDKLYENETIG
ncbi:hypothetical protein F5Y04DRAFT_241477 [Hypomontagnella monticulosa]|nr:hypothetical protein F5Y04DRAFT_241477 [Hypomontagnella monticulosa]